jgi:hypothetical protein
MRTAVFEVFISKVDMVEIKLSFERGLGGKMRSG